VKEFPFNPRETMKNLWVPSKKFKTRSSDDFPTKMLRTPYQYVVAMLFRIYGDIDAHKFKVSWVPLIYSIPTIGFVFNWESILSSTLEEAILVAKHIGPRKHPSFHISYYLLDIICMVYAYLDMIRRW
jgi:hypothetical protein